MKTVYAYSIVYREKDDGMKHSLGHCWTTSKQEARGWVHEQFEEEHPDCKIASLLIREIEWNNKDDQPGQDPARGTPEFTLKPNF